MSKTLTFNRESTEVLLEMESPAFVDAAKLTRATEFIKSKLSTREYAELRESLNFDVYPFAMYEANESE